MFFNKCTEQKADTGPIVTAVLEEHLQTNIAGEEHSTLPDRHDASD